MISIISLKNEFREFDKRSKQFLSSDHFINSHNLSLDNLWILLGEKWCWSLLGLKGFMIEALLPHRSSLAKHGLSSKSNTPSTQNNFITHLWLSSSRAERTWPELMKGLALLPCFSNRSTNSMLSSISLARLSLTSLESFTTARPSRPCTTITGIPLRCRNAKHEASFSNWKDRKKM